MNNLTQDEEDNIARGLWVLMDKLNIEPKKSDSPLALMKKGGRLYSLGFFIQNFINLRSAELFEEAGRRKQKKKR